MRAIKRTGLIKGPDTDADKESVSMPEPRLLPVSSRASGEIRGTAGFRARYAAGSKVRSTAGPGSGKNG